MKDGFAEWRHGDGGVEQEEEGMIDGWSNEKGKGVIDGGMEANERWEHHGTWCCYFVMTWRVVDATHNSQYTQVLSYRGDWKHHAENVMLVLKKRRADREFPRLGQHWNKSLFPDVS